MSTKCGLCGVFLLTLFIFSVGNAELNNETTEDLKNNVTSITWSPGEELSSFNQQFTGWISSPPEGATTKSGKKLTIWLFPRGTSEEVCFDGNCSRSDRAMPLVQYGNNRGVEGSPKVNIQNNDVTVKYTVTYSWTEGRNKRSETLTITETYSIPPVHPSCSYVLDGIEIIRLGLNQRIPMNDTALNFDLYLKPTKNSSVYGKFFIEMKNFYYEIRKDKKHYYAVAKRLGPNDDGISTAQEIFPCDGGKSLCSPNATLEKLVYYDAFGRPKSTTKSSVVVVKGQDIGWNVLIPTAIVGWFMFHILTDKTLRLR